VVLIDVLDPIGKPGNSVVMDHLFPRPTHVWFWDRLVLTNVDRDVLRADTVLAEGGSD